MENKGFDKYAQKYDSWFIKNQNVLYSEARLVAYFLKDAGDIFSVGCGSGLFEMLLARDYDIIIKNGLEPSAGMAEIAKKRGVNVDVNTIEEAELGCNCYDTILFNGTPSYITNLQVAFNKAYSSLRPNGKIVVADVPKESSYALLYNLAKTFGKWEHPLLADIYPQCPYPIELVDIANWRTTKEKTELLIKANFTNLKYAQTLTKHPVYSNDIVEEPIEGYDSGDYVAICAIKK